MVDGLLHRLLDPAAEEGYRSSHRAHDLLLGLIADDKVALIAAVSKDLMAKGVSAGDCVKTAAKIAGGGGGGRPDLAEAGGKDITKLAAALAAGATYFRGKLA